MSGDVVYRLRRLGAGAFVPEEITPPMPFPEVPLSDSEEDIELKPQILAPLETI